MASQHERLELPRFCRRALARPWLERQELCGGAAIVDVVFVVVAAIVVMRRFMTPVSWKYCCRFGSRFGSADRCFGSPRPPLASLFVLFCCEARL